MKSNIKTKKSIVNTINKKVDELKEELITLLTHNQTYIGKPDDWAHYLDPGELNIEKRMRERLVWNLATCIEKKIRLNTNMSIDQLFNHKELQEANKQLNDRRKIKKQILESDEYKKYLELKAKYRSYDSEFYLKSY